MVSYAVAHQAYLKIIIHAAKHPHLPVNGVLLGKPSSSGTVLIEDAIPLLHHWTSLSPMMEIALDLSRTYAEAADMTLVGYYQACERLDDTALAPVGERVASKIREQFVDGVAFVIDGRDFGERLRAGEASLIPYLPQTPSAWRPFSGSPSAFTTDSQFTLASSDSPSRAAALVAGEGENNLILSKFGDFDDHLEDVSIDWLRNRAFVFLSLVEIALPEAFSSQFPYTPCAHVIIRPNHRGDLVHCPALGQLDILHDHLLEIDASGFLTHVSPATSAESRLILNKPNTMPTIIPSGSFLLPTFCDLHLHAPQYLYQGTGLHLPLMEWLNEYAFKAEERLDADPALARMVYQRLAERLAENGTGAVLFFGTIKEETNLILADVMQRAGLRAFVGKLSMDISSRPSYIENSPRESISAAESFVDKCYAMMAQFPEHRRLVEPVITPRFVPTCSDEVLTGLGAMSEVRSLRIQSHLAEAHDQVEWVKRERGIDDIEVFDRHKLLTPRTVQAHCTFLDPPSLSQLCDRGTAVAHCPLSNAYFSAKPFPLREALHRSVKVGLGTDVAGGYSLDIMNAMRQAVTTSRMREGARTMDRVEKGVEAAEVQQPLSIDWKEALYLATRGGALALGLQQGSGVFEIGAPFDAQHIRVFDPDTKLGLGAIDFFSVEASNNSSPKLSEEIVEKWWCLGDADNRDGMWVQGAYIAVKQL